VTERQRRCTSITVRIARALSDTFAGIAPGDAPGFILAQLIGAVAAAYLFGWLFIPTGTPKVKTHKVT
jgi:hypothetical protein